jgi:hypothetical protein
MRGGCLSFDGTNKYVQTATGVLTITSDFTFSAFIYPTQNVGVRICAIMGNLDFSPIPYGVSLSQFADQIRVYWFSGASNYIWYSKITTANTWYYLVLRYTSGTFYLYINGVLQAGTKTQAINQNNTKVTIGRWDQDYNDYYFSGLIDDVRIYNRALSAQEIQAIYNATK